ncbi:MAG TPA: hypothetical protein VJZ01_00140 [Lachnospiraceae bacterium]|nr:hypothetical protein [Lachnospiraceae bacterium]
MHRRRTLGYSLFLIAVGMMIMMFIPNAFIGIIIVILLLILGYNLYCW